MSGRTTIEGTAKRPAREIAGQLGRDGHRPAHGVLAPSLSAHEVRPAYLELTQTSTETYEVLWKAPARGGDQRLALDVELPPGSVNLTPPHGSLANHAFTARWTVKREGGLAGGVVRIAGLTATVLIEQVKNPGKGRPA